MAFEYLWCGRLHNLFGQASPSQWKIVSWGSEATSCVSRCAYCIFFVTRHHWEESSIVFLASPFRYLYIFICLAEQAFQPFVLLNHLWWHSKSWVCDHLFYSGLGVPLGHDEKLLMALLFSPQSCFTTNIGCSLDSCYPAIGDSWLTVLELS